MEIGKMEKCMVEENLYGETDQAMKGNISMAANMDKESLFLSQRNITKVNGQMENKMEREYYSIHNIVFRRKEFGKMEFFKNYLNDYCIALFLFFPISRKSISHCYN